MPSKKNAANRWKSAEKAVAKLLQKYNIPAERISRSGNYSVSDFDVRINGYPEAKIDSKYSVKSFHTTTLLNIVREKYCEFDRDIPMLFCKGYQERGFKVTADGDYFAMLLAFWLGKGTKEELWAIFTKQSSTKEEDGSEE